MCYGALHQLRSLPLDLQPFLAADADAQAGLLALLVNLISEHGDADGECANDEIQKVVSAHVVALLNPFVWSFAL